MSWKIEIEKADNGYIAHWLEESEDADFEHSVVFEELDAGKGELDTFVSLVRFLADHFGVSGSKHDKYRFSCEVVEQGGV